ncbi:MAG: methylmalonyl-CoA mutase family protein, partial [Saprospiraceae bacterium]|nr:methylmalonyl-CoA mutase family protein [Saprospiraceae bacterium]
LAEIAMQITQYASGHGTIVTLDVGNQYLAEIAKIRALKVLILNIWNSLQWNYDLLPEIECHISSDPNMDPHTDLISKTCRAVQCVLGGVDRIIIHDFPGSGGSPHLCTNIQHILKLEGWLDQVQDPLAGSYMVDKITELFTLESWKLMNKKRAGQNESK